ncbi:hypothetical protein A3J20_06695 [Candidatus Gottesmanbacteria bacterium RIFCSPLOWO2_02_FULL_42_29]|nr:MAG: hypothetical protein A3J20_06695 [Candidatus Gottesmanbacteria bacterium RIFCSPLOWO2_02_FULL_42_29]
MSLKYQIAYIKCGFIVLNQVLIASNYITQNLQMAQFGQITLSFYLLIKQHGINIVKQHHQLYTMRMMKI